MQPQPHSAGNNCIQENLGGLHRNRLTSKRSMVESDWKRGPSKVIRNWNKVTSKEIFSPMAKVNKVKFNIDCSNFIDYNYFFLFERQRINLSLKISCSLAWRQQMFMQTKKFLFIHSVFFLDLHAKFFKRILHQKQQQQKSLPVDGKVIAVVNRILMKTWVLHFWN